MVESHRDTVREMERRLSVMKARMSRSPEDLRPLTTGGLEVGQLFRETLKARAGFWTGCPIWSDAQGRTQRYPERAVTRIALCKTAPSPLIVLGRDPDPHS